MVPVNQPPQGPSAEHPAPPSPSDARRRALMRVHRHGVGAPLRVVACQPEAYSPHGPRVVGPAPVKRRISEWLGAAVPLAPSLHPCHAVSTLFVQGTWFSVGVDPKQ